MIHIAPWAATKGLFAGAASLLAHNSLLYLYGPFHEADRPTAMGNQDFDRSLKERNPEWGLRLLGDVEAVANTHGFALANRIAMPANNLSLEFRRLSE